MTAHQFLWLDLETTGLIPGAGRILEWAAVLCEDGPGDDFAIVEAYSSPIHVDVETLAGLAIDNYVMRMHTTSGLWTDVEQTGVTLEAVESFLVDLATRLTGDDKSRVTLAGNSIHFDRAWIGVWMPRFWKRISHRVFDVSTLSRAAATWGGATIEVDEAAHRALDDVKRSIEIARQVRKAAGW